MALNGDLLTQILGCVDGITVANAACVSSDFRLVATQESIWEEKCSALWPSIADKDIKELITSSLGGFRKFFANCFSLIVCDEFSEESKWNGMKRLHHEGLYFNTAVTSDFMWLVDVQYKKKNVFSKALCSVPYADKFPGWFYESPFRVDIVDGEDEHTNEDGLPTIMSVAEVGKIGKIWGQLMDDIELSWIVISMRTGQAANLSSWSPLIGLRQSTSDGDFLIRFGSILPAHHILECKFVRCILEMKCRVSESDHTSLKIIQLSMRLEDMTGDDVNGRNSLHILEKAVGCGRISKDHNKILEVHRKYIAEQSKLREANKISGGSPNKLCIISVIFGYVLFFYFVSSIMILY